ncbi:MAG: hypothetical protein ABJA34_06475 [Pseudonocardiales bacterium]
MAASVRIQPGGSAALMAAAVVAALAMLVALLGGYLFTSQPSAAGPASIGLVLSFLITALFLWPVVKAAWGRHNHQLVADLPDGETVVVWGARGAAQHDRIVSGLAAANQAGLIPPTVAQADQLYQAWPVVADHLDHLQVLSHR